MKNNFGFNTLNFNPYGKKHKRSLGTNEKHILYDAAGHRCVNPYCRKKISESEMQIGHKKAYSKGGITNLSKSICLCSACNRKQGTDSWEKFLKKQAIAIGQAEPKLRKSKHKKTMRKRESQKLRMLSYKELMN